MPVYRQIMDQVRFQVAAGLLTPGAELPSTRSVSQELGVNPMTVSKAYGLLEEEGLVIRRPGLPLVVAAQGSVTRELLREQLRTALAPAARAVRQLGVSEAEAIVAFREALGEMTDVGEG